MALKMMNNLFLVYLRIGLCSGLALILEQVSVPLCLNWFTQQYVSSDGYIVLQKYQPAQYHLLVYGSSADQESIFFYSFQFCCDKILRFTVVNTV